MNRTCRPSRRWSVDPLREGLSDAGPLIHLSWIGQLGLLSSLFDDLRKAFASNQFAVYDVADLSAVQALAASLDLGESEALILMRETQADLLLVDDRRARLHATRLGYPLTGTIGILRTARNRGLIPSAATLLEDLQHRGFRLSATLFDFVQSEEINEAPR
jgi:predicted nucleic acid-binding protein